MKTIKEEVAPEAARKVHRQQRTAWLIVLAICFGLTAVSVPLVLFVHQVFLWGALIGVPLGLLGGWKLVQVLRRDDPPRYTLIVGPEGITAAWAGVPSKPIAWRDVLRVMDTPMGYSVIGGKGASIGFPHELGLEHAAEMRALIREYRASAPPPMTQTRIGLEPGKEPVPDGSLPLINFIDRVRGPIGWTALGSLLFIPLGLLTNPLLAGVGGGLCAFFGGLYWCLVQGVRGWALGAVAISTAFVVQTTYRGGLAKFLSGMHALTGAMVAMMGVLVTFACLVGLFTTL
jgi:hypothetical protein